MQRTDTFVNVTCRLLVMLLGVCVGTNAAYAALTTVSSRTLSDSEEPISRRIYSYDMGIDSRGDVHIVFSRPSSTGPEEIIYSRRVSGLWTDQVLSSSAGRASISTHLVVGSDDAVHVCYIKSDDNLYYVKVVNGVPGTEKQVDGGAWHSRMQLDANGRPVFARESATWPALVSKLALMTTTNGETWSKSYLDLPAATKFRLGDFVRSNGTYHLTYGDGSVTKQVLNPTGSTTYVQGTFHNLYHASSTDGVNWTASLVDGTASLYENEFWTSIVLDGGNPVVGMYRYAEYGGIYNTGTSGVVSRWTGSGWEQTLTTPAYYRDTREGMGIALVSTGAQQYLGVWDFSPADTHDAFFRGERGNIALVRSGEKGAWTEKLQVDPFSAEGRVVLQLKNDRLHILVLGDFVDAKLYYRELDMSYVNEQFRLKAASFPWEYFLPAIVAPTRR